MESNVRPESAQVGEIAALRQKWSEAAIAGHVPDVINIVTDDVVVVFADGRCLRGKDELKAALEKNWAMFDADSKFSQEKAVVEDHWAIEICRVDRTLTSVKAGSRIHSSFPIVVVAARQPDASWKIARVLLLE